MSGIYLTSFSVMDLEILDTVCPKLSSSQQSYLGPSTLHVWEEDYDEA